MTRLCLFLRLLIAFSLLHSPLHAAKVEQSSELRMALKHSGGNRAELEVALRKIPGRDIEYLLAHASQYDLVNLTSQQIIENITYARKVHVALPYLGKKIDDEMWREWVLPQRVLDEDLDLWRKDFYEQMQPLLQGKRTVREVVDAAHAWLMEGTTATGAAQIAFGNSEDRCKSPQQMRRIGKGSCGELSMMFVYVLRAVGIPARHGQMSWRYYGDSLHYYCEYWDAQVQQWIPLDASDEKPIKPSISPQQRTQTEGLGVLAFYAHRGFPEVRDSYHAAGLDRCLTVTANMLETYQVEFGTPAGFAGTATVHVWNSDAWRAVARGTAGTMPGKRMELANAKATAGRPVLFTATDGKTLLWAMQVPAAKTGKVELIQAVPGQCLSWADYGKP